MKNRSEQLTLAIKNEDAELVEKLLEKELEKEPRNCDLLLELAIVELAVPLVDYERCLEILERILKIDPTYIRARIMKCCVHAFHLAGISKELVDETESIVGVTDKDKSILRILEASYFGIGGNEEVEITKLEEAIKLNSKVVWPYLKLSDMYEEKDKKKKSEEYLNQGISNVIRILACEDDFDFTSYDNYIGELVFGIYIPEGLIEPYLDRQKNLEKS